MYNRIFVFAVFAAAAGAQPLRLEKTIPLPGVEGRFDHLAADVAGKRLFVAALGNNSLEVIDVETGKRIHTIGDLHEPQGLYFWPELNRVFLASAADGKLRIFDGASYKMIQAVEFKEDADNVRFDPAAKEVIVGYGDGALGLVNVTTYAKVADIPVGGHPESFQLEKSGPRIFVNVPKAGSITVVDRRARRVIAKWPVDAAKANYPMTLNEADNRVLVGCRKPAKILIFDAATGKVTAAVDIVGDTDDLFYDAAAHRVYVSGGQGAITVLERRAADRYERVATIPTAAGARTSLFVPEWKRLCLAVPHRGPQQAEIRIYAVE